MSSETERAQIVVLGASFAGIELLYQLLRSFDGKPPSTVVIDRQSEHGYLPLVQERMCGVLDPEESTLQTRAFIESIPGARFVQGEVEAFDPEAKLVTLADGRRFEGRFVVVALGSGFEAPKGIEGSARILAYKSEVDFARARQVLDDLLRSSERAHVTVVGGGISGCELAGELGHLARTCPRGWSAPQVTLVSSSDALVPNLGARMGGKARRALEGQGVKLELGSLVTEVTENEVQLRRGENTSTHPADLVLWAGGVRPASILARLGLPRDDDGWLKVGPTLQCFATPQMSRPDIFACGDAVRIYGGTGPWRTMQRAIECLWQAKIVARNIAKLEREDPSYSQGVPALEPHSLREEFFYGLSLGGRSMVVYRGVGLDLPGINHRFRRWLMRQFFARYAPLPSA